MSEKRKISIVVLGTSDSLKKSLVTAILRKDVHIDGNKIKKYDSHIHEVTYTPNFYTAPEDIEILFSKQHCYKCLFVVKDDVPPAEVRHKLEYLQKITGKTKEEFTVVLPHSCKTTDYPANCSLGKLLHDLAEEERMMPPNKSFADQQPTEMESVSGECHQRPIKCGKCFKEFFPGPKKSLKEKHSDTDNKVKLVLLGMHGTGKSASGNTILGKEQFSSEADSMPVTTECQVGETEIDGTCVRVIDTPDIFDDDIKPSDKNQRVKKCKQLLQSGPCVFLLVMNVGRFTDGEKDILKKLEKAFGSEAKEQTVILFTRGEELWCKKKSKDDFLHSCNSDLKKIVEQCGRRCVVFENKTPCRDQVTELMQTVIRMLNK